MRNGMQIITLGFIQSFKSAVGLGQLMGPLCHQRRQLVTVLFQFQVVVDASKDDSRVEGLYDVIDSP